MTRAIFILILFLIAAPFGPAKADCVNPAGVEGDQVYNGTHKTMQFCDGTNWWGMKGGNNLPTNCNNGETLEFDGTQWNCVSNGGLTSIAGCSEGDTIHFDSASGGVRCPDKTPDAFTFTDQTDVSLSTVISSDIVQITGIESALSVSISGDGSPEFRICSDSGCGTEIRTWGSTNWTINNGEFIQLRMTSNSSTTTGHNAVIQVGTNTDTWTVTTTENIYYWQYVNSYTNCGGVGGGAVCNASTLGSIGVYAGTTNDIPASTSLAIYSGGCGGGGQTMQRHQCVYGPPPPGL